MLKRKITQKLVDWKNSSNKKALIVKGLRQVGKTFIIEDFCMNNYKNYIYINFKNNEEYKRVFDNNFNIDRITMELGVLIPGSKFVPKETIIFLDEIQDCAKARACLKPFVLDGRYDVIASGSMLGLRNYNRNKQDIPVGYEKIIEMHPLDFEEFLWAKGISEDICRYVSDCLKNKEPISDAIHKTLLSYFRQYIVVGGMPSVVNLFLSSNDLSLVREEQIDLINSYRDDFGKHLNEKENEIVDKKFLMRIQQTFDSIPCQLAKENKKFIYSEIKEKVKAREYYESIRWLIDYGLIKDCYCLNNLESPLEGNKTDNIFKLYFSDSGLFMSLVSMEFTKDAITKDYLSFKGPIYENIVADSLTKNNKKLYYYSKRNLEVDFVINYDDKPTLLEVKSSKGVTKSSTTILKNKDIYKVDKMIKLSEQNISYSNNILTIPYYLTCLIR